MLPFAIHAQDTTQAYPWRLSYFPYLTASPNDGVMAMGRVLFFRQSRWDDRVSLHSGVAIEGGYSTKNSWLARVRGDFPRIADGWRLQAIGEAARLRDFGDGQAFVGSVSRQVASLEVTRHLEGAVSVALRGDAAHVGGTIVNPSTAIVGYNEIPLSTTDVRGRIALVVDSRDREYDTRSGILVQTGFFLGSSTSKYSGWYGLASGWAPLSAATRITGRFGARMISRRQLDIRRTMPAWEDEFVIGGGPESNRALSIGARTNTQMLLGSVELRHDLKVFPGGALAVLGFVDGGRAYCDCIHLIDTGPYVPTDKWVFGPGAGVSLRLLRNAILTATVARAEGSTRVYVSSGWSW